MLTPENVFLAVQPVDMRRGIDTLTQYVRDELKSSWHEGAVFVFTNKVRSRIKVLRWDGTVSGCASAVCTRGISAGRAQVTKPGLSPGTNLTGSLPVLTGSSSTAMTSPNGSSTRRVLPLPPRCNHNP
jgi:hypothetical protein